ncbi:small multidrug resistance pump [Sphingomonas jejuensis]|uniref:Small multidrug resistance pump n=1 Tax=Sphingomonas jejuensis TaxID=904715 RepID=A0ABX0XP56_9SPHN|nr:multidrug efflux SMR transporter [Sphingomonas jejuensis]NJC34988.1 small multidrug resistance pump [Sphingomonas jejuensis]
MTAWIMLGLAIALEIAATSLLKAANGFTRPAYGVASIALYAACFWLLGHAFTRIPMGIAYAIWSGVGIAAIALIGWSLFRQPLTAVQVGCIGLILAGAVGLNLATPTPSDQRVGTGVSPDQS